MNNETVCYDQGFSCRVDSCNIRQTAPHWHDTDIEIVFVLEGKVFVHAVYDNFQLAAGDFVVINHEDIHTIHSEEDNVTFLIHMSLSDFEDSHPFIMFQDLMCESFNTNSSQTEYARILRKLFMKLILEWVKRDTRDTNKLNALTEDSIKIMATRFDIAHYYNDRPIPDHQLQRYYRIMRSIALHYDEKITMEDIASEEYIGKNYISQFWKKMLGINFTDYLNSRRTEVAQKLMLTTSLNLQEISLKCGFSDSKYFYKYFKRWYGTTPSEHKKKYESLEKKTGHSAIPLEDSLISEKYSNLFVDYLVDGGAELFPFTEIPPSSWRQKFEQKVLNSGRRIKREMMKENQRSIGLKEIFLPLFDRNVVHFSEGEPVFDWNFIGEVIHYSREMNYFICIEINYSDRNHQDWQKILDRFTTFVLSLMGKECLSRFRFHVYFTDVHIDAESQELINFLCEKTDSRSLKVAVRYQ